MTVIDYATQEVVSVSPQDDVDKAIALMEEFNIHHLPVLASGRVVGMVSDRDILLAVGWELSRERRSDDLPDAEIIGPRRIEQIMSQPVVTIIADERARHAARLMLDHRFGALPVLRQDVMVAILSESDLLRHVHAVRGTSPEAEKLLRCPVSEFMRARVVQVKPGKSVIEVIDLIRTRELRHVPVTVDRVLKGIISDRDVRRALGRASLDDMRAQQHGEFFLGSQRAREIMTTGVATIAPDATMDQTVATLLKKKIHCLPVVALGKLVGIVTHTDVLRALLRAELP